MRSKEFIKSITSILVISILVTSCSTTSINNEEKTEIAIDKNVINSTAAQEPNDSKNESESVNDTTISFAIGNELTINALRDLKISGSEIIIEQNLEDGYNYHQYIASYLSEGLKIYGLLAVPMGDPPEGGYKAIVFNHGYIPPYDYYTTRRYTNFIDTLAQAGFVVFKIDMRGHGNSEGDASGAYFSPGYTIDAISALKSLQTLDFVDPEGIGMWGHSMSGNIVLRAMLVEEEVKAGVIWAGAVYSYEDILDYSINDTAFDTSRRVNSDILRRVDEIIAEHGAPDLDSEYWQAVSLTENIDYLENPLQIHHAQNDDVVTIQYSYDLLRILQDYEKEHEMYIYDGGGHNITSPYFEEAMQRTIDFFRTHL